MNRNYTKNASRIVLDALLIIFLAMYAFPLYILVNTAVKSKADLAKNTFHLVKEFDFSNFTRAIDSSDFFILFKNSLIITVVTVVLLVVISTMASYYISRSNNRFSGFLYIFFVSGLMVPVQLIMLPLYKVISLTGLMDSHFSLIVTYIGAGMPFLVFFCVGFLKTIPKELDEAACIDGASKYRTFWIVIFPLLKTAILTATVLQIIWVWNDFLIPLLFLKDYKSMTIMVGIYSFMGERGTDRTMMFALILISIMPVVITYVFFQKYIVEGLIAGAIKA